MKKSNITNYFIKAFILIIVIPIFIMNYLINQKYEEILINNYSEKVMQVMEQMANSFESENTRISLLVSQIANDDSLLQLITNWHREKDSNNAFEISKQIDSLLNFMLNYDSDLATVAFLFQDDTYYYYKDSLKMDVKDIKNTEWYKLAVKDNNKVIKIGSTQGIGISSYNSNIDKLSVCISPNKSSTNDVEMIYFEIKTSAFATIYSNYNSNNYENLYVIDSKGNVITSSDKQMDGKNIYNFDKLKNFYMNKETILFKETIDNEQYINTYYSNKSDWMIINIINRKILNNELRNYLKYFYLFNILIVVFYIIFSILFFNKIIYPIKQLIIKMKNIQESDFDSTVEVRGLKEICDLNDSYNIMIYRIKKLMNERDIKEKERSQEEIKVLQAQINPHFIYNTLNTIKLMAIMSNINPIKDMVDSFMRVISRTFKSTGKLVYLKEEIEYLNNYFYILKVRFGDNFSVRYNIDEKVENLFVLSMILQPIIENSITHGFDKIQKEGIILIKAFKIEENLIIEIVDNGCGIGEEKLEDTYKNNDNKSYENHMGIYNVNKRIKLNFGENYGLYIRSKLGYYTCVKIVVPIIKSND